MWVKVRWASLYLTVYYLPLQCSLSGKGKMITEANTSFLLTVHSHLLSSNRTLTLVMTNRCPVKNTLGARGGHETQF